MAVTALDDATLARMRAEAEAEHGGPFIDPALLRKAQAVLPLAGRAWLTRVTGRADWRQLGNAGLALAVRAAEWDSVHLAAARLAQRAEYERASRERTAEAERQRQAEREAWERLRAALPGPVEVWHNWTARHLDGYEQGADHIVTLADLHAGRLHRAARSPLCWTPSRAHELRHVYSNAGDDNRIPDCKACLRTARRLAGEG